MNNSGAALLALSLMAGSTAFAQSAPTPPTDTPNPKPLWLNVGGLSRHFDRDLHYNERNFGLGLEYRDRPDLSYLAGAFRNSVRKTTSYIGVHWQPWTVGPFRVGATVGVMNGYPSHAKGGAFLALIPMASWEGERYGLNVGVVPTTGQVNGAVIVQFKLRVR